MEQLCKHFPKLHERYFIDTDGQLYTDLGKTKMSNNYTRNQYISNTLYEVDGTKIQFHRHRLVLMTFCPVDNMVNLQVNHKDGNKLNNRLENLEWTTPQENTQHAWDNGKCENMRGENHPLHKLSEEQVKEIYEKIISGNYSSLSQLARDYQVSNRTIGRIRDKISWKKVLD